MLHVEAAVAFRQSLTAVAQQQRQMDETGRREVQQLCHIQLLGRRQEQVAPPHHLINPHQGIVDDDGQLVGPSPVLTADDEVAHVVC